MEARKHINCDISSVEIDRQSEKLTKEDNTGVGRSYECTFCKGGFTNAQALGGHMNIHRRDKSKVKKKNEDEPSTQSISPMDKYVNSRYYSQVSSSEVPRVSYQRYIPLWRPEDQFVDYMNVNLSTRNIEEIQGYRDQKLYENEEVVDLELRLGHDP